MNKPGLQRLETHFEFGENWRDYLANVDDDAIREAERGLLDLLPREAITGSRFIDIGCGSGLHSLAALRLGAAEVVAVDIDPNSVSAARDLLNRYAPGAPVTIRELSIFDAHREELGEFDIVYSWGVLHHTGAMWAAIEKAAGLVRQGGHFAIALYQKRPTCGFWRLEKRLYTNMAEPVRAAIRGIYKAAFYVGLVVTRRNPWTYVANYKGKRGMNFHNDVHDWLGGYPYESATPEEVKTCFARLGFRPIVERPRPKDFGLLGTGCAEFTFRRG
ncbi:MAG: class I SAM-dependent methyltransferase [Sphingomonas sp.]|nr:class I SAM-dependent methyltransferase [Sphingomonas sp.]